MADSLQSTSSLQTRIAALSPAQQQLFRKQLEAKGISWDQAVGDTQSHRLPLSASQKHLWVLHQLYPDTSAYHIALSLEMKGKIDVVGLQKSIQNIVNRHNSLRMIFLQGENQPYIKILPAVEIDLSVIHIDTEASVDKASVDKVLGRYRTMAVKTPFDLEKGPLLRTQLIQKAESCYELILVLHHLIADGWSRGIFLGELATHYQNYLQQGSLKSERLTPLPVLTAQYSDYILQQQEWLKCETYEQQRTYWQQQLADLPELDLPIDHRPGTSFTSQTCIQSFTATQTLSIKALARRSGVSTFMWLLAVFKLLLHRYSGQRDIAVGVPVAGRNTTAVESLIGFFVNTLVLRSQIDPHQSFPHWLKQIQSTLSDAIAHQDIPFSEVVDAVGTARIPGRNPLFRVMFQVQSDGYQRQNAEKLDLGIPGVTLSQQWIEPGETKFDMSWHVIERDGCLVVAVEYRTELFERDRISRMLQHFHRLVDAVVTTPNQTLAEYSLLSESEQAEILETWRQPKGELLETTLFPSRFEQQVKRTPEAIAICDYLAESNLDSNCLISKQLTYDQLNQRANQLAHWLRAQGVGIETLVGICLSPGLDLMTALLAVMKSGGAYLPLDPALPTERLRYMLKDAKPGVLLAHRDCLEQELAALNSDSVLYLGERVSENKSASVLSSQPTTNLTDVAPTAKHLAYVIYTSGSTGQPKGTQLTHGGLINYLNWCLKTYPVNTGCGAPVQSSIGFDATITSLFSPLLAGKQVVFGLEKTIQGDTEIEAIQAALSGGFSFVKLTPAHLSALQPLLKTQIKTQKINRDKLPKAFVIGGEALQAHHISTWREHYPEVALFNEYGPTEATVGCCVQQITDQDNGNIPIGRPIDGMQLYVLDEAQQPVPVGVPGELYIGGVGVARGYLNQSELTAERFVEGKYKTGDRVAYKADGSLEYFGRVDSQIKLRGFRIEPGEIESVLCQHEQVEQAVVVLHTEQVQEKQALVAYVTTKSTEASDKTSKHLINELRSHLTKKLPSYMVPAHIVVIKALPLTVNGKINRRALPTPNAIEIESRSAKEIIQPRDRKETIILAIWQQILDRTEDHTELSIHDNFFDLGGDSISGMQIVSKAREQGLHLTPSQLFQYQTIAEQAVIAQEKPTTCTTAAPTENAFPLSPIQRDFFDQNLTNPHHYNQAVMLRVKAGTDASLLRTALTELTKHHDSLRLRFEQSGLDTHQQDSKSSWTQYYESVDNVFVPLDEWDLTSEHSPALDEIIAELQASLHLTAGPLFRGALLSLETGKHLLLIAHHLLVDGLSWRILLSDLALAYQQLSASQPIVLPTKTTAFSHWVNHLNKTKRKQQIQSETAYWTNVCSSTSPLPVDESSRQNATKSTVGDTREIVITLDDVQTSQLQSAESGIDVLLLTALAQTLKQWSQVNQWVVDVEGHGRHLIRDEIENNMDNDNIDISRTVGWFTALYPLRLSLSSGSISDQIMQVQKQLKQVPNHGLGYGLLQSEEICSPADISFNYLGQLSVETTGFITGLAAEPVRETKDSQNNQRYLFEIIASIQSNQLKIIWRYSQKHHQLSTVRQLSAQLHSNICSLIAQKPALAEAPTPVAASFSAARVESTQLSQLMGKLQARGGRSS